MKFTNYLRISCIVVLCCPVIASAESTASIRTPGPELANFPNSAFTLPQGRAYVEMTSIFNNKSVYSPDQYTLGYMLRYGLTDAVELRVFSLGFTVEEGVAGISPQNFDIKWHLLDAPSESYLPAVALEASVQTTWSSPAFKSGTQPTVTLNFDHNLPYDIALEYNLGMVAQQQANSGQTEYQLTFQWALQRDIVKDVALFINGYTNTGASLSTSAIGGGAIWTVTDRVAVYTNISAGLTASTPALTSLVGVAVAF